MKRKIVVLLSLLLVFAVGLEAQELTGQQILDDLSFDTVLSGSGSAELIMITENARGAQRKSTLKVFMQSDETGDRQFLEYLAPADVRGTKFLSVSEVGQEDQMWIYMPAMGRERRVAAHMTGDSFMDTDFTYDEIGGNFNYDQDYKVERLADAKEQDVDCYVLDLQAQVDDASYSKIKMWVWQAELVPMKVEFYGEGDHPIKTLILSDFRIVSTELIPHHVVMENNVKGTKTILDISEVSQEEVSVDVFSVRNLRR